MSLNPQDLRRRLWIIFPGEEGLDYGGVARWAEIKVPSNVLILDECCVKAAASKFFEVILAINKHRRCFFALFLTQIITMCCNILVYKLIELTIRGIRPAAFSLRVFLDLLEPYYNQKELASCKANI